MPRAKALLQSAFPYNIGARCINREWFNLAMPIVWSIFCEELNETTEKHRWKIHSFVLMSNHYHLIVSTPESNISQCMQRFAGRVSRNLNRSGNRINETFAGRHFKCILHQPNYYLSAYKYNYRNPVVAGLCERVEDYPYSSLRGLISPSERQIKLAEDDTFGSDPAGTLAWLNRLPDSKKLEGLRYALKRQIFKSKKHQNSNVALFGPNDVL